MNVRLFVGNIAYACTEAAITREFADLGIAITNVKIARDKETQRSRGFAFIEVDPGDVAGTIDHPPMIEGRVLRIERAQQQPDSDRRRQGRAPDRPFESHERERRQDAEPWREDRRKSHRR